MGQKQILWGTAVCLILILAVAACTTPAADGASSGEAEVVVSSGTEAPPTLEEVAVNLPDMGEAPEFQNDVWLNSDGPVTLAEQRGKVVLLEFWTFG